MATIGDGLIALAIALAIVGFAFCLFYLLPISARNYESNYEICINHCPKNAWTQDFTNLDCPRMCIQLSDCNSSLNQNIEGVKKK